MSSSTSASAASAAPSTPTSDLACASSIDPTWVAVCPLERIAPLTGVCARVGADAVAIFRVGAEVYAIADRDPFTGASVLSRGIVGDRQGVVKVASPLHKQSFALATGECLDDPAVAVAVYPVRVVDGVVELRVANPARAA